MSLGQNIYVPMTRTSICYGTGRIENFEDLPAIDMAAIQNSCFAQTINSFFWFTDTTCQR